MRDILVEQARRKTGAVRGGGRQRQELDEACAIVESPGDNVLAVHEALEELEKQDPLKAQIVLLRYFRRQGAQAQQDQGDVPGRGPAAAGDEEGRGFDLRKEA
jgi:UDP-glucose 4-epimerase